MCIMGGNKTVPGLVGNPDVVFIIFDDAGFSQFGCSGSNLETPHIDRLA